MPRPSTPRLSSAPGILDRSGGIPASSSTEMPQGKASPGVVQPRNEGPLRVTLQRLVIVSRGTRPECVQVTRMPAELQNPDWEVILKSLHRIDNPQRDRALQGHIGTNPRMILQLVKYQPMQTAVLRAALVVKKLW